MTSAAGAEGVPSSTSLPEHRDALVLAVTHGLAELPPGPELVKECAARRGEIWTIIGQLQEVVRFTEQAMKDEERQRPNQHSHRLRLAADLLHGLTRGADLLERYDKGVQSEVDHQALDQEYSSIRSSVGGLNTRVDHISHQLKERDVKLSPDGRDDPRSRLISPLLGVASTAVALLGAGTIGRGSGGTQGAAEVSSQLSSRGTGVSKSTSGGALNGAVAAATRPKAPALEDSSSQFRCTRCRRNGAKLFCDVAIRSIFDVDPRCRHGPFCNRCKGLLVDAVLATCTCRALISSWRAEDPG